MNASANVRNAAATAKLAPRGFERLADGRPDDFGRIFFVELLNAGELTPGVNEGMLRKTGITAGTVAGVLAGTVGAIQLLRCMILPRPCSLAVMEILHQHAKYS